MPEHAVLPNIRMTLTLEEIYRVFAAGVAYGARETADIAPPALASLLTTLRDRYLSDHLDTWLGALDDAPAWLEAQQHLRERALGETSPPATADELPGWLLAHAERQAIPRTPPDGWGVEGWPV